MIKLNPPNKEIIQIKVSVEGQEWIRDNLAEVKEKTAHMVSKEGVLAMFMATMAAINDSGCPGGLIEMFTVVVRYEIGLAMPDMPQEAVNSLLALICERLLKMMGDNPDDMKLIAAHYGFELINSNAQRIKK